MRSRAFRRHQTDSHMWRRLKEDRNQHYNDLECLCWYDGRAMSRMKEQPKLCGKYCCANPRRSKTAGHRLTMQERRHDVSEPVEID